MRPLAVWRSDRVPTATGNSTRIARKAVFDLLSGSWHAIFSLVCADGVSREPSSASSALTAVAPVGLGESPSLVSRGFWELGAIGGRRSCGRDDQVCQSSRFSWCNGGVSSSGSASCAGLVGSPPFLCLWRSWGVCVRLCRPPAMDGPGGMRGTDGGS